MKITLNIHRNQSTDEIIQFERHNVIFGLHYKDKNTGQEAFLQTVVETPDKYTSNDAR